MRPMFAPPLFVVVLAALPVAVVPVWSQVTDTKPPRSPKDAAAAFTLDAVVPEPDTTVTVPPEAAPATPGGEPEVVPVEPTPPAPTVIVEPTLDTPIAQLLANFRAKAVLDRDLPGLSDDENLAKFRNLSLRQFQPLTGGQLTDAMLDKVAKDLAVADGAAKARPRHTER